MTQLMDLQGTEPGAAASRPFVVGIGGTLRPNSSSESAVRDALRAIEARGAETELLSARELDLPMYNPGVGELPPAAHRLLESVRRADALVIATPGYHGGLSGLLKNALDYLQELAGDPAPYLHEKAVGCIVTAAGWQAGATTLASLRATVHALRGWPTPLGVVVNTTTVGYGPNGELQDDRLGDNLATLAAQVSAFARMRGQLGG